MYQVKEKLLSLTTEELIDKIDAAMEMMNEEDDNEELPDVIKMRNSIDMLKLIEVFKDVLEQRKGNLNKIENL